MKVTENIKVSSYNGIPYNKFMKKENEWSI